MDTFKGTSGNTIPIFAPSVLWFERGPDGESVSVVTDNARLPVRQADVPFDQFVSAKGMQNWMPLTLQGGEQVLVNPERTDSVHETQHGNAYILFDNGVELSVRETSQHVQQLRDQYFSGEVLEISAPSL